MSFFSHQKKSQIWGLDISDLSLKLVGLKKSNKYFSIINYNSVSVPPGVIKQGEIQDENKLLQLTKQLIATAKGPKLTSKFIHTCLPEPHSYIKLIKVPTTNDDDIPEAAKWAAEHNFPYPLDEIYLDWQVIKKIPAEGKTIIMIGASPAAIVKSYTNFVKKAELIPLSLEIESIAIARTLIDEIPQKNDDWGCAIIDLGASRSSLIVCGMGAIVNTFSLPFSGKAVTTSLQTKLGLSPEQAEKAKRICGIDEKKCQGVIRDILTQELKQLVSKIKSALSFYEQNNELNIKIKKIILTGGGANMLSIDKYLTQELDLPVTIANPLKQIDNKQSLSLTAETAQSFTTAIGLAIKPYL